MSVNANDWANTIAFLLSKLDSFTQFLPHQGHVLRWPNQLYDVGVNDQEHLALVIPINTGPASESGRNPASKHCSVQNFC